MVELNARFDKLLKGELSPLQAAVLADDIGDGDYPYVINLDGNLIDPDDTPQYIHDVYGAAVRWTRAEPDPDADYIFRLVGFAEYQGGSASLWCFVIDHDTQAPMVGVPTIRWWPDAPAIGTPILPPASAWHNAGIVAWTKPDGVADWGVGRGEAYFPELSSGPCEVWVCSLDGPSDLMQGWGWLDGTPYRSLRPIFERYKVDSDNGGGGDGEIDLEPLVNAVLAIRDELARPRTISTQT